MGAADLDDRGKCLCLYGQGGAQRLHNPYVDAESNGLTWLVERFKGQRLAGHVTLIRGERSELAELAANLL